MNESKPTFSKYGKHFQEVLAKLILFDRGFSNQIQEVLDLQFLEYTYLQVFSEMILDYKKKYKVHPTLPIIKTIYETEIKGQNEAYAEQLGEYLEGMEYDEKLKRESVYIKEEALNFCRKQKMQETILKIVPLLKSASFEQIQGLLGGALKLGTDTDHGHNFLEDFEKRYEFNARSPISTGWSRIDNITKGGFGRKELSVVISTTGGGKSMCLVNLGAAALLSGKNVVYYTLELSDSIVGNRFDSCITGVPIDDLHHSKPEVLKQIKGIKGRLIIKEYPSKRATPKTIENHIERLVQDDFKPDLVIIDYADLLRPSGDSSDFRPKAMEEMYEELRGIAQLTDTVMITASQTNRTGVNADVITMESIADAYAKCFPADFIFTISKKGKALVAKNRNGVDGVTFAVERDFSRCKVSIKDIKDNDLDLDSLVNTSNDSKLELLAERYKKFISNGGKQ